MRAALAVGFLLAGSALATGCYDISGGDEVVYRVNRITGTVCVWRYKDVLAGQRLLPPSDVPIPGCIR